MKEKRNSRRQAREDVRFVRQAGKLMLLWEKQRTQEIETHLFLLNPEAQARLDEIKGCVRAAKLPPTSFACAFDPVYNQITITLEDDVFSDYSYPLQDILSRVDAYSIDALNNGRLVLSANINNAAYEMEA